MSVSGSTESSAHASTVVFALFTAHGVLTLFADSDWKKVPQAPRSNHRFRCSTGASTPARTVSRTRPSFCSRTAWRELSSFIVDCVCMHAVHRWLHWHRLLVHSRGTGRHRPHHRAAAHA